MKITLPENISEITLGQYQRYLTLIKKEETFLNNIKNKTFDLLGIENYKFFVRKLEIFTSLNLKTIEALSRKDFEEINAQIDKALNEDAKFVNRFFIGEVEFGFVNLDKISQGEYIDLCEYSKDIEQGTNLNKLMAVLFRPIIDKGVNNTYRVETYSGSDEYFELMKRTPMNIVNGCLGFFLTLQNDLLNYILKYTEAEQVKEQKQQDILKNGVG